MSNLLQSSIEIDAGKDFYSKHIDLYVFDVPEFSSLPDGPNPVKFLEGVTFAPTTPGTMRGPSFKISFEAAQHLMDALWNCNIRPSEEPSAGQLQAMNAHLQDMRKIAFAKMHPFTTEDGEEWTPMGVRRTIPTPIESSLTRLHTVIVELNASLIKEMEHVREAALYTKLAGDTAEETIIDILTKKIDALMEVILPAD